MSGTGNGESDDLGIAGYVDGTPIGQGGFGSVFRCRQVSFDRLVAIKVLAASGLDEAVERRFERECRAVGSLSGHPHILTVHESGLTKWGRPYIVMDYMAGGSIADRLQQEGPLDWREAVEMGVKVSGAVAAAHSAGIIHRDIKPQNILISSYGEPKLSDFGISTIPSGYQTHSGVITTSLAYAPPEILNGEAGTAASDVYSLGATIFSLIKGSPPFVESGTEGLAALITGSLTKPVPDLRSKAPASVCEVLERAMSKDPAQRHASAAELGEALRSAQEREGVSVTPMAKMQTPRALATAAMAGHAPRPIDATISSNRKKLFEDRPPVIEEQPARSRSRLVAMVAGGVLVLASSGVALALREAPKPTPVAVTTPTLTPTPSPTPTRPAAPQKAKVKRFTLSHSARTGVFSGKLVSIKRSCEANRKVELYKRDRKRPLDSSKTSRSGEWRVRLPRVSGVFFARVADAKRGKLICQGARTKPKFAKPKPAAPGPLSTGPTQAPPPATDASDTTTQTEQPPSSSQSPRPDSSPPQEEAKCPPGHHEENGRCYPD